MAKMFYTLEEAAKKLNVLPDKVREMASNGQLQEFRDRDKLVFKREQVDMLSGGEEDTIPLADSGAEISLAPEESKAGSGSGSGMDASTKDKSGISIFEGEDSEETDASAQTQITASMGGMPMGNLGDPGASGSGLLDVTKTADDTGLNADLLGDVYAGGGGGTADASTDQGGGALFESTGVASDVSAGASAMPAMALMMAEPYDGPWSGLGGGLALGMVLVLAVLVVITIMALMGVTGFALTTMMAGNMWMYVGILGALVVLSAVIGWVMNRKG